jgi:protein N-terminal methyltransferase
VIDRDVRDSNLFLDSLSEMRPQLRFGRAADCGAGIGRVSKNFLLKRFESVELVEQSPRLLRAAPEYLGEDAARATYLLQGLQVMSVC